jgi:hypothetical protein
MTVLIEHSRRAIRVDSGSVPNRTARSKPSSIRSTMRSLASSSMLMSLWIARKSAMIEPR